MIASMMIGRKLIVCAGVMPKMCWPQPHWNIATCAPSAAAIESRKPRIDVIGTRIMIAPRMGIPAATKAPKVNIKDPERDDQADQLGHLGDDRAPARIDAAV